jgi:hypothetical protein
MRIFASVAFLVCFIAVRAECQHSEWLTDVAACSSSDIWAVGDQQSSGGADETLIMHYDGHTWTDRSLSHQSGSLESVACISTNEVWAVGFSGTQTLVDRFNGSVWSASSANNPGTALNALISVGGLSATSIWVVGTTKDAGSATQNSLIEFWDGGSWHVSTTPSSAGVSNVLSGVAAIAADNVWAVGNQFGRSGVFPIALHWNGSSWSVVQTPVVASIASLNRVRAVAANDVWAVGGANNKVLAEHWDGASWKIVPMQDPLGVNQAELNSLSIFSGTSIWAVGETDFSGKSLIEHYNGSTWNIQSSPNPHPAASGLSGVAAINNNDVWAVGNQVVSQGNATIMHWDGSTWATATHVTRSPEDEALDRKRNEDPEFTMMSSAAQRSPASAGLGMPRRVRSFMSSTDTNGNEHNATADIHAGGVITCSSASSSDPHNPGKCYVVTSGAGAYQLSPRQTMGTGPGGTMTLICNGTAPMTCWVSIVD